MGPRRIGAPGALTLGLAVYEAASSTTPHHPDLAPTSEPPGGPTRSPHRGGIQHKLAAAGHRRWGPFRAPWGA